MVLAQNAQELASMLLAPSLLRQTRLQVGHLDSCTQNHA